MGRPACCDKVGLKKGPWTPDEDRILVSFIHRFGYSNWRALPKQAGLLRCGKSCRLRWMNYLRPDIKRGNFTKEEENTIIQLHQIMGNRWSAMAAKLPGRTDNEIKNIWHTHLKKKLIKQCQTTKPKSKMAPINQVVFTSPQSYTTSNDSSCLTEVSSLQESNNVRIAHANIKDGQMSDMDYFSIIDDTFWSDEGFRNDGSLNMPSTFSNSSDDNAWNATNNFTSMNDDNYGKNEDFWCDIFLTESLSSLEF